MRCTSKLVQRACYGEAFKLGGGSYVQDSEPWILDQASRIKDPGACMLYLEATLQDAECQPSVCTIIHTISDCVRHNMKWSATVCEK